MVNVNLNGNAFYSAYQAFEAITDFLRAESSYHSAKFWNMVKKKPELEHHLITGSEWLLLPALVEFINKSDLAEAACDWFNDWSTHKEVQFCEDAESDWEVWDRMDVLDQHDSNNTNYIREF